MNGPAHCCLLQGNQIAMHGVVPSVFPFGHSRRQPAMRCRRSLLESSRAKPLECSEPAASSTRDGGSTSLEALRGELHAAIKTGEHT